MRLGTVFVQHKKNVQVQQNFIQQRVQVVSSVSFNWFLFFFKNQDFQNSILLGMVKNNHSENVLPFNHYFISLKNIFVRLLTSQTHVVSLR